MPYISQVYLDDDKVPGEWIVESFYFKKHTFYFLELFSELIFIQDNMMFHFAPFPSDIQVDKHSSQFAFFGENVSCLKIGGTDITDIWRKSLENPLPLSCLYKRNSKIKCM